MFERRMQQLLPSMKMAKNGDFVNGGLTGNLPSGSSLEAISRENFVGCSQNPLPGQINGSVLAASPFGSNAFAHASIYLHRWLIASAYLQKVRRRCSGDAAASASRSDTATRQVEDGDE